MHTNEKNLLILLTGPSGSGKSTISNELNLHRMVTTTTRTRREGEVNGVDYYFTTEEQFSAMVNKGEFIEYAKFGENYYGLTKKEYSSKLKTGDTIIVCDPQGVRHHKKINPDAISLFVMTAKENVEAQLKERGDSDAEIMKRLQLYDKDIEGLEYYDYIIENKRHELSSVIDDTQAFLKKYRGI